MNFETKNLLDFSSNKQKIQIEKGANHKIRTKSSYAGDKLFPSRMTREKFAM